MGDPVAAESTPTDSGATTPTEATTMLTDTASVAPAGNEQQTQDTTKSETPTAEAKPVVPEEYAEFTLPEGYTMDEDLGTELKATAKEMGLTQSQAQKLADMGAKQSAKFQAMQSDALQKARSTWETEAKADKDYGGERFGENLAVAKKAMDAYASPELKTLLNQTGLGSHPEFIRLMWKAGQSISQDRFDVGRDTPQGATRSQADRLYGKN